MEEALPILPEKGDKEDEEAFRENLIRLAQAKVSPSSPSPDTSSERPGNATTSPSHNAEPNTELSAASETNNPYFQLPDTVRFNVMKYLLAAHAPHGKPIRMNNPVFLWEVWPVKKLSEPDVGSTDYFDSLQSVLSSVDNYTSVCSAMRADVLATLFLTRRFHVVYSPYVNRKTQPVATKYMDRYGPLMASITLEIDFTKLAGSWRPEAVHLDSLKGLKGVKTCLEDFVQCQHTRHNTAIRDLRVLIRRYHGFRPTPLPANPPPPAPQPIPYTSPSHIAHTLAPLNSLGPLVSTLTLTGAPYSCAADLLSALRGLPVPVGWTSCTGEAEEDGGDEGDKGDRSARHVRYRVAAIEYPLLPGQKAVVGARDGGVVVVEGGKEVDMGLWEGNEIGEEMGEEM
ncbi:hypothetical protein B0I37DRAFT_431135 [Chaetomium sp. MPI-CAGE-AT-0009]|nr:hypothetical protein B0I37DRAFT_431135 [Chaetomium sp. MPI-CAGE-AT-0009]